MLKKDCAVSRKYIKKVQYVPVIIKIYHIFVLYIDIPGFKYLVSGQLITRKVGDSSSFTYP